MLRSGRSPCYTSNTNNLSFLLFYTLEILDCSPPDFKTKKLKDDRCKEPKRKHYVLSKVKGKDRMSSTLDEPVYNVIIDEEDTETKSQSSCLDSLPLGNSNSTIPISQSHPFSYCKAPNISKKYPDHGDEIAIESASSIRTDAVPSTKKTERRGGKVAVVKPSGHKVKLQDVVRPPDIKILKPVNSTSDIDSLLIRDLGQYLHILNIGQYAKQLADAHIDGILLKELHEDILIEEFGFKRFEAIKLMKFARHGYLPKPSE